MKNIYFEIQCVFYQFTDKGTQVLFKQNVMFLDFKTLIIFLIKDDSGDLY